MSSPAESNNLMEAIVSLAKRRGFIFPSSEIYGGLNGFFDYGPLGVRAEEEHPRLLVERHGPPPRRRRRPRILHHHAPEGLGGLRPRRRLHRSAGGLQGEQAALSRGPAVFRRRGRRRQNASATSRALESEQTADELQAAAEVVQAQEGASRATLAAGAARQATSPRPSRGRNPADPLPRHRRARQPDRAARVQHDVPDERRRDDATPRPSPICGPRRRRACSSISRTSSTPAA